MLARLLIILFISNLVSAETCLDSIFQPSNSFVKNRALSLNDQSAIHAFKNKDIVFIPETHVQFKKRKLLGKLLGKFKKKGFRSLTLEFLPGGEEITEADDAKIREAILRNKPNFPKKFRIQTYVDLVKQALKIGLKVRGMGFTESRRQSQIDKIKPLKGISYIDTHMASNIKKHTYDSDRLEKTIVLVGAAHLNPEYLGAKPASNTDVPGALVRLGVKPSKILKLHLYPTSSLSPKNQKFVSAQSIRDYCKDKKSNIKFFDVAHWYTSGSSPTSGWWPFGKKRSDDDGQR